jgi:hypothetical protein
MKTKMLIVLTVLMALPAWLHAGFTQPAPVIIELAEDGLSGFATGDMLSARDSVNPFEFIGCGIRAFETAPDTAFYQGFCQARLVDGETFTCFTNNKALLDGIQSIADNSFVTFSWTDDGTGSLTCSRIGSSTQSFYLPKIKSNL